MTAHIDLPAAGTSFDAVFEPFEIKTFRLKDGAVGECDMLEGAVPTIVNQRDGE